MQQDLMQMRDAMSTPVEPPAPRGDIGRADGEYDVIVVGFGIAGASAAIEAAERGLEVLVIDRFQGGGSSQMSGGVVYAGGGTSVQRDCGVDDSVEAMTDYLCREVDGFLADETVRRFCEDSIETLAFLQRLGAQFSGPCAPRKTSHPTSEYYLYYSDNATVPAYRGNYAPAERGHRAKNPALVPGAQQQSGKKPHGGFSEGADMGWYLMAAVMDAAGAHPRIHIMRQARVDRLIIDDDGRVSGVQAGLLKPGGCAARFHKWAERMANKLTLQVMGLSWPFVRLLRIVETRNAERKSFLARKGVVLAAGGYIRNSAMMERFARPYRATFPIGGHGDDGAGIRLGVSAGGVAVHMDRISAWRFINPPYAWTKGVVIGATGERITNEEQYGAHLSRAIYEKSDGRAWLIVDQAIWDSALEEVNSGTLFAFQRFPVNQARKAAVRADSIAALAAKIGVPPGNMCGDIEAYDAAARSGAADPKGKSHECRAPFGDGPYYAIDLAHKMPTSPITAISTGGLKVHERTGAVVTADGGTVRGLFAAGRTAIGLASNNYVSGLSLADGVWSGRRTAAALAAADG